ncbi:YfjI family protein [Rhodopirellula sallentina]|uniref:DUF3987 domain-containing protein n=1 Tax=Rhodopirellula sallentina SM41 TaxID=1263870 RepID=M5UII1_9BACT|nr:YfjI family protein [Rhodopirellula sallentina]EMI55833.1 hypothetical protein RSSM_02726 [Rhodopirellula sallentina SM41]
MSESKLDLVVANIAPDGCHVIVVTLGEKEVHRDVLFVDRADDRRRFIDAVVAKLPAITDDAEVSPEDIDAQLLALASKMPPAIDWREPEPIGQPDLPVFPVDALPSVLANWVAQESEATQTPADMAALLALAVCAATLARRVTVEAWPGWSEPCNLYVAAILDPANRKSAVFADATRPLREVEDKLREDSAETVAAELSEYRQAEKRLAKLEKTAAENADATKREDAKLEARELAKHLATCTKPEEPTLMVDDATSEKLAILMQANGERLASMSAEGGVFDLMAGKYSGTTDINVYLMGHSGDAVSVQRVMRGPVKLESPALTMALAIQPEVIRGIAENPAFRGRGLLGRFLYAIPKSWIGRRKIATPPVSDVVSLAYSHTVKTMAMVEPDEDGQPHRIKLATDAMETFKVFCESIESELGSGSLAPMKDWGGKLAGATLRIAGILHCAGRRGDGLSHDIDVGTIEAAQRIARWAIPHAAAAMDLLAASEDEARDDAEYLLRWLRNDRPDESTFARRDAQRHGHRRFTGQPLRLDAALDWLESTNHIAKLAGPKVGGRVTYAVSPYVTGKPPNQQTVKGGDNGDDQTTKPPSPLSPGFDARENDRVRVAI